MTRICADCPAPITDKSKTGRCRRCVSAWQAANPEWRAKQRAAVQAKFADPEHRAAHIARLVASNRSLSPEARERKRAHGRRLAATVLSRPELRAALNDPAMKAESGRKRSATVLAWCPPDWRDRYRELKKRGRRAPVARTMVLAEIAMAEVARLKAEHARIAAMSPFERQLERVRNGAKLITVIPMRRADPAFTLGGVAPEAM